MITEEALGHALPGIILGVVLIVIAVWLYYAFTRPKNKCIAILLNGFAVIAFLVGESITNGPNPKHYYGGFKQTGIIPSGPRWGFAVGSILAAILMLIARYFAKKNSEPTSQAPTWNPMNHYIKSLLTGTARTTGPTTRNAAKRYRSIPRHRRH